MNTDEGYEEEVDEELPAPTEDSLAVPQSTQPASVPLTPAQTIQINNEPPTNTETTSEPPTNQTSESTAATSKPNNTGKLSPTPKNPLSPQRKPLSPPPAHMKAAPHTNALPKNPSPIPSTGPPVTPASTTPPASTSVPFVPMPPPGIMMTPGIIPPPFMPLNPMMINPGIINPDVIGVGGEVKGLLPLPAAPMPAIKRAVIFPDVEKQQKIDAAEARVQADPYDSDSWSGIIMEAQLQPIEKARDTYERCFAIFPTAGRYWKYYAEQEMAAKNYDRVEKIFLRCLRHCPNIDLWRTYITYIRTVKGETAPAARDEVRKAFEFALEHMGMDISSTQIWQDFLTFLKAEKAANPFEEGNKMTAIRRLFQRATENPMHNLESIWKDYDQFENNLSKILAKALLTEQSPKYMGARVVYRERKSLMEGILRNMLARPPRGTIKEEHQVRLWRRLLVFEKTNPQKLDAAGLRARVTFTYNQCLLCLYHYPDMWLEFATYQNEAGAPEAAIQVFERALLALPNNLFMHFAYADFLESHKKLAETREVYEKFMQAPSPDPLVVIQYMRFARRTEGIEGPRRIFKRVRPVCAYYVFIALAHIEFFVNKNPRNARDVFEDGLKRFPQESVFALQYMEFMKQLNEDNNTRALYERILLTLPKEKAQEVWTSFASFEYTTSGDLSGIMKLEKRRSGVYPEADPTGVYSLVDRYKYLNLWPCTESELESFSWGAHTGTGDIEEPSAPIVATAPGPNRFPRPDVSAMVLYRTEMSAFLPPPIGPRSPIPADATVPAAASSPPTSATNTPPPAVPVPPQSIPQPLSTPIQPSQPPIPTPIQPQISIQTPIQPPVQPPIHQQPQILPHIHPQTPMQPHIPITAQPPPQPQPPQPPHLIVPEFLQKIISLLPPSNQYHGPFLNIDAVMSLIRDTPLPPPPSANATHPPASTQHMDHITRPSSPTHSSSAKAKQSASVKRKNDEDSDEEPADKPASTVNRPPTHDIYRNRQAQRMSKFPRT